MNATQWAGSCACYIISCLSDHKDAKDAMLSFCRIALKNDNAFGGAKYSTVAANYVFTSGPEVKNTKSNPNGSYCSNFAAYIRTHKLGIVRTPGKILNKKHHPNTTCQTWVWRPDQKALEVWFTENSKG